MAISRQKCHSAIYYVQIFCNPLNTDSPTRITYVNNLHNISFTWSDLLHENNVHRDVITFMHVCGSVLFLLC